MIQINEYHKLLGKAKIIGILPHSVKITPTTKHKIYHRILWVLKEHLFEVKPQIGNEGYYAYKSNNLAGWFELHPLKNELYSKLWNNKKANL